MSAITVIPTYTLHDPVIRAINLATIHITESLLLDCPNLEALRLSVVPPVTNMLDTIRGTTKLEGLQLVDSTNLTDEMIESMLSFGTWNQTLIKLYLVRCPLLRGPVLHSPHLSYLEIQHCHNIETLDLSHLTRIRDLIVRSCDSLRQVIVNSPMCRKAIFEHCPQLSQLRVLQECPMTEMVFVQCPQVTDETFVQMSPDEFLYTETLICTDTGIRRPNFPFPVLRFFQANQCQHLETLYCMSSRFKTFSIRGCPSFEQTDIRRMIPNVQALKVLDIFQCTHPSFRQLVCNVPVHDLLVESCPVMEQIQCFQVQNKLRLKDCTLLFSIEYGIAPPPFQEIIQCPFLQLDEADDMRDV
jgi:hypothetical protein